MPSVVILFQHSHCMPSLFESKVFANKAKKALLMNSFLLNGKQMQTCGFKDQLYDIGKLLIRECKIRANLLHPAVKWRFFRCIKKITSPSFLLFIQWSNFHRFWNILTALGVKRFSNFGVGKIMLSTMF